MKKALSATILALAASAACAYVAVPKSAEEDTDKIMSQKYWDIWNPEVQKQIDADIDANRKANASIKLADVDKNTKVTVEQISHDFIFGAHIFNFDQLGDETINAKYRSLYGTLFNSATVAFYWSKFEMQPNRPRFSFEYWDSEKYWNDSKSPKTETHWRRPAADKIVDFCKSQNIRIHGHTLVWGNRTWQTPTWIFDECAGADKAKLDTLIKNYPRHANRCEGESYTDKYKTMSPKELAEYLPEFTKNLNAAYGKRIAEIAEYYGDKIDSWDVVNESATDFGKGNIIAGDALCKSWYGIMPGDYPYKAIKAAQAKFPKNVKLNINDYKCDNDFANEIKDIVNRGGKIDIVGSQMHLFNPKQTLAISKGEHIQTPKGVEATMKSIDLGYPIHLSEITITAPDTTKKGRMMQAIITRNLYRKWFSIKPMMGITWWNVVDDCGAPGEPSMSGLFTRTMNPKPAFFALNDLINSEWKTILDTNPDENGVVNFRGFKGKYRISWTDKNGKEQFKYYHVK